MTDQLYVTSDLKFVFHRSALQEVNESNSRDLFVIDIPFMRDPVVQDFVDTTNTISIQGELTNAPVGDADTAYNDTDGGGVIGQLERLRTIANSSSEQSPIYLTIDSVGGTLYSSVKVYVSSLSFRLSKDIPKNHLSYTIELKRGQ